MSAVVQAQEVQLPPTNEHLSPFDYVSTRHAAKIPVGVDSKDILKPSFWAHHAKILKPRDEICAWAEDNTWMGELVVLDCAKTWARVQFKPGYPVSFSKPQGIPDSKAQVQAVSDAHEIKWRAAHKWSIVRKADGAVLHEGIEHKEDAEKWLRQFAKSDVGGK